MRDFFPTGTFSSALEEQVSLIRYSTSVSGFLRQAVFFQSVD